MCACARARSRLVVVSMLSDVVQCVCLDCDRVGGRSSVAGAVRADCDAFVANFVLPRRDALMSDDDPVPSVRVDTCAWRVWTHVRVVEAEGVVGGVGLRRHWRPCSQQLGQSNVGPLPRVM